MEARLCARFAGRWSSRRALGCVLTFLIVIIFLQVLGVTRDGSMDDGFGDEERVPPEQGHAGASMDNRKVNNLTHQHAVPKSLNSLQEKRKMAIRKVCGSSKAPLKQQLLRYLLVDDVNRVVYCVVPKVACTNMKRLLVNASLHRRRQGKGVIDVSHLDVHNDTIMRSLGLRYLNTYRKTDALYRLKEYYKFMFVREPFARLLSAFRDKFERSNKWNEYFHHEYGRYIIRKFRHNPSNDSLKRGDDVQFDEFVKFVLLLRRTKTPPDDHWTPIVDLCHPCAIEYDFIGTQETLTSDTAALMNKILDGESKKFPSSTNTRTNTYKLIKSYYSKIPKSDIKGLQSIFQEDFKMFGYNSEMLNQIIS